MDNETLNELKKMNKILALLLVKDMEQNDKIKALSKSGFQPKDIADLIDTTANTVSIILSRSRKKVHKK